jgi:hypothetical protein
MSNNLKSKAIADPPVGDQLSHPAPVPRGAIDRVKKNYELPAESRDLSLALFRPKWMIS